MVVSFSLLNLLPMEKKIFEESYISCTLNDSIPVLSHCWLSHTSADNFRNALIRMADTFKELKKTYPNLTWLGDTTHLGVLSLETQTWLKERWTDYMFNAGVRQHALIVPKDVFAKFAMNKFKDNADAKHHDLQTGHFTDEKSALAWLKKCLEEMAVHHK